MLKKSRSCAVVLSGLLLVLTPQLPASGQVSTAQGPSQPGLVVMLVVDQLRVDYLTEYGGTFKEGLQRLMREGAWFKEGAYPYLNTVTCAGHATIGTGTFPYQHGMILNNWLDRETRTSPYCTDDAGEKDVSYNGLTPAATSDSAKRMLRPALAEQIHERGGRSVVMSLKPRSAIPLAGDKADAVVWFDERGGWTTSTAFAREPVPFLKQFIDANPFTGDYDKVWERSLEPSAYRHEDEGEGEGKPAGWTRVFPHALGTPGGKPDPAFYSRWQRSPFSDEYLARMAMASVDALNLGKGKTTDFLGISFSALDLVGHAFGPRSHEVQDLLVRLDRTIGRLLQHLDKTVGAGNYVLGFTSDHGVAEIPDQTGKGGRQTGNQAAQALMKVLEPAVGPGRHVFAAYTDIYLSSAADQRLDRDENLRAAALNALASLPAVDRVFRAEDLASDKARSSTDPVLRAAALSFYKERSGDLIIVPKEHWLLSATVTTHGTHHGYDQRVPVILFGASVKAGEYSAEATPADIAPTLAAVAGVRISKTDGRALTEAIAAKTETKDPR
jgi:predicted AlkP superfamily pyrophosphatase or phosphodiesterase